MPLPAYRLDPPDAGYRISADDREKIRAGFDADALERLLAMIVPDARPELLRAFQWPDRGVPAANIVKFQDPDLQAVLDEVWLPMWEREIPDAVDAETKAFPGLELARRRRAGG